tara:strand:+ start:419 stop:913 length:495 start_codon:yes stop_codon:yes gene_type:complete
MPTVGEIATRIYDNEFDDQPTQLEREFKVEGISGWLESNVGQLNNLLYSSFSSGTNFKQEEENIFTQIYLQDYYTREARVVMKMSASTGSIDWTRLTEGDTTIVRSNRVDVSRLYRNLAKDASEKIKELVYAYNSYQAMPRQTAGFDGGFISGSGYYRYPPYIT